MDKSHDVITFFQRIFILRRPGVAIFAEIIKILTTFIKAILQDSRKVGRIRNYVSEWNLYLYFLIWQNLLISGKKMLLSAELKERVTWVIYFLDLFPVRYNCAKFHHCRICATDFRERGPFFALPNCEEPRKSPSWIGLIVVFIVFSYIYRKCLCKSLRVGVSFLIKLIE